MVIFFAGNGRKTEECEELLAHPTDRWGVLLSYKDLQTKDQLGPGRFKKIIEKKRKDMEV